MLLWGFWCLTHMNKLKLLFSSKVSVLALAGALYCGYVGQELQDQRDSLEKTSGITAQYFTNKDQYRSLGFKIQSCNRLLDKHKLIPPKSDLFHIVSSHCRDLKQRGLGLEKQQAQLRSNEEVKNTIARYNHLKADGLYILIGEVGFVALFYFGLIQSYKAWKKN